ncbi:MAG: hypothetical protein ABSB70_13300 [Candidatus Velthaea sp.]
MEYRRWTRNFWIALKPDAGESTLRFDMLDDGKTILEMAGTVRGRGVLLRWLNDDQGILSVRSTPYHSIEEHLDGEPTPITIMDDPAAFAARAHQLLSAFA